MPDHLPPPGPERDAETESQPKVLARFRGGPLDGQIAEIVPDMMLGWRALATDRSVWLYAYRGHWIGGDVVLELDEDDAARWPWYAAALLALRSSS